MKKMPAGSEPIWIVSDPKVKGGAWCIAGTRIPVIAVQVRFAHGETIAMLAEGFPGVPTEAIAAAAVWSGGLRRNQKVG